MRRDGPFSGRHNLGFVVLRLKTLTRRSYFFALNSPNVIGSYVTMEQSPTKSSESCDDVIRLVRNIKFLTLMISILRFTTVCAVFDVTVQ